MKELLCNAFCSSLNVRSVPVGYAVQTPYANSEGDPLLLYYVRDATGHNWRIEDDGTQIPLLEANGVDLAGRARGQALDFLLNEYGAHFDRDERVLHTSFWPEKELGQLSIRFIALLLRLQDLTLLSPHIVRNTFREDVIEAIKRQFAGKASVEEGASISGDLSAYQADCVISKKDLPPLAVYLGVSEERALQALVLKMELEKYRHLNSRVVLILEKSRDPPLREATYALSHARLDNVLSFRGVEVDAMDALQRDFLRSAGPLQ